MLRFIKGSVKTIVTACVVAFLIVLLVPASAQANGIVMTNPPAQSNCPEDYEEAPPVCTPPKDPSQDRFIQGNVPTGGDRNWVVTYGQYTSPYLEVLTTLDMLMKVVFGMLIGIAAGFLLFSKRPSQL